MKSPIEQLESVQRVSVPENLYDQILKTIDQKREQLIRPVWIKAAAAFFILLISTELSVVFYSNRQTRNISTEQLVDVPNNMLYE